MGNDTSIPHQKSVKQTRLNRFVTNRRNKSSADSFFVNHHRQQQHNPSKSCASLDALSGGMLCQRVVFISLLGLYDTWKACPTVIMHSAVFMLPLKKEWILNRKKIHKHIPFLKEFENVLRDEEFMSLLKWKHHQGLVFWMKDRINLETLYAIYSAYDDRTISVAVHPFWRYVSWKLSRMHDAATGQNYQALCLDLQQWNNMDESMNVSRELCRLTMTYKTIEAILRYTNPSLRVITKYVPQDTLPSQSSISSTAMTLTIASASNIISPPTPEEPSSVIGSYAAANAQLGNDEQASANGVWWISAEYD